MTTRRDALKTMAGAALVPMLGGAAAAAPVAPTVDDLETRAARYVVEQLENVVRYHGGTVQVSNREQAVQWWAQAVRRLSPDCRGCRYAAMTPDPVAVTFTRTEIDGGRRIDVEIWDGSIGTVVGFTDARWDEAAARLTRGFKPIRWIAENE